MIIKKTLLIIALFIDIGNVNAQSYAKPTMQETFKYLINVLPNYELHGRDLKIRSFNEEKLTIEMVFCENGSGGVKFSLNDIKSVEYQTVTYKNGSGTVNPANKDNADRIMIFLTQQNCEYDAGDCHMDGKLKVDYVGIGFNKDAPENSLEKLYKAFNHVIDLNGNRVNVDLFGN